jgi:hypothetical protein
MLGTMWKVALLAQRVRGSIVQIGQLLERAFHPPFGHGLAGMLAGIEPDLLGAFAERQAVDRLAVERDAQLAVGDARLGGDAAHQIVVPLHRIGREIGEPDDVAIDRPGEAQHAIGIAVAVLRQFSRSVLHRAL